MAGKTERARHAGGLIVAHVVGVIVAMVLGLWTSTQWIASMLAFWPELGRPWFTLQTYPVYLPWKYLVWMFYFNDHAPKLFTRAMIPVALGACVWRKNLSRRLKCMSMEQSRALDSREKSTIPKLITVTFEKARKTM